MIIATCSGVWHEPNKSTEIITGTRSSSRNWEAPVPVLPDHFRPGQSLGFEKVLCRATFTHQIDYTLSRYVYVTGLSRQRSFRQDPACIAFCLQQ